MTDPPTTPETDRPKVQFSLLTLMIWVTVVGLYFGLAGLIPREFFYTYPLIYPIYLALGLIVWIFYSVGVKPRLFSILYFIGSYFSMFTYQLVVEVYPFYKYILLSYFNLCGIFLLSFGLVSTLVNCKKQTGSWLPFVGERAEAENNE